MWFEAPQVSGPGGIFDSPIVKIGHAFSPTGPHIHFYVIPGTMNLKYAFDFAIGICGTVFAALMFFYFPGLQAWTTTTLHPFAGLKPSTLGPGFWMHLLLVFAVVLPGVFGPVFLVLRARRFAAAKLIAGCLALSVLFLVAAFHSPLLYGRVALLALLSGQLLALGLRAGKSVPWNWMVYLSFALANFTFPDPGILRAANSLAGGYLLATGLLLLMADRPRPPKDSRYRVMVG